MTQWSEDFSGYSLEEVLRSQTENREWSRELRLRTNALVNSRLANNISQADYLTDRKLTQKDAVECRRRAGILDTLIADRASHAVSSNK
jgi:hypothetical protein